MSESLWKVKSFVTPDVVSPIDIIREQCAILNQMTEGKIIGRVISYDRESSQLKYEDKFYFQFFLTSQATPRYKFRVCYMEHGIAQYPVYFALDTDIASELGSGCKEIYVKNEEVFRARLSDILNSKKMEKVITNLLAFNVEQKGVS